MVYKQNLFLKRFENLLNLRINFIRCFGCVKLVYKIQFLEVLDDGHGGLLIGHKPLLQTLLVIVRPATPRCASAQAPSRAYLLAAVEEENTLEVHLVPHLLGPSLEVVLVPGEAIDQKPILVALGHGALQQRAGDLHRDDGAIGDVVLYQLSKLRPRLGSLLPQQISSRKMNMSKVLHDSGALSALASPGAPQHEDHVGFAHHKRSRFERLELCRKSRHTRQKRYSRAREQVSHQIIDISCRSESSNI